MTDYTVEIENAATKDIKRITGKNKQQRIDIYNSLLLLEDETTHQTDDVKKLKNQPKGSPVTHRYVVSTNPQIRALFYYTDNREVVIVTVCKREDCY